MAINIDGQVAFGGRDGDGTDAVFIQDGRIAKEGDTMRDGTILQEISENGGVAINPYGRQVAFHGQIGTTDEVFVGLAPVPPVIVPPAEDE